MRTTFGNGAVALSAFIVLSSSVATNAYEALIDSNDDHYHALATSAPSADGDPDYYDYGDYFDRPLATDSPSDSPSTSTTRSLVTAGSDGDAPPASVEPDVGTGAPGLRRRGRPTTTPTAPSSEATTRRSVARSTRGRHATSTRRRSRVTTTTSSTTTRRLSRSEGGDGGGGGGAAGDDSWLSESSPFLMVLGEEENYPSQRSPNANASGWSALWLRKLELESKLNELKYSFSSAPSSGEDTDDGGIRSETTETPN